MLMLYVFLSPCCFFFFKKITFTFLQRENKRAVCNKNVHPMTRPLQLIEMNSERAVEHHRKYPFVVVVMRLPTSIGAEDVGRGYLKKVREWEWVPLKTWCQMGVEAGRRLIQDWKVCRRSARDQAGRGSRSFFDSWILAWKDPLTCSDGRGDA